MGGWLYSVRQRRTIVELANEELTLQATFTDARENVEPAARHVRGRRQRQRRQRDQPVSSVPGLAGNDTLDGGAGPTARRRLECGAYVIDQAGDVPSSSRARAHTCARRCRSCCRRPREPRAAGTSALSATSVREPAHRKHGANVLDGETGADLMAGQTTTPASSTRRATATSQRPKAPTSSVTIEARARPT
jgi:hypothetical protein